MAITFYIIAFVVIFTKWPAGHGKELRGPSVPLGSRVEDPCSSLFPKFFLHKVGYHILHLSVFQTQTKGLIAAIREGRIDLLSLLALFLTKRNHRIQRTTNLECYLFTWYENSRTLNLKGWTNFAACEVQRARHVNNKSIASFAL